MHFWVVIFHIQCHLLFWQWNKNNVQNFDTSLSFPFPFFLLLSPIFWPWSLSYLTQHFFTHALYPLIVVALMCVWGGEECGKQVLVWEAATLPSSLPSYLIQHSLHMLSAILLLLNPLSLTKLYQTNVSLLYV